MKKFWKKLSRFQKIYFSSLILFLIILPVVGITTGMFSVTPTIFRAGTSEMEITSPFGQAAVTQANTAIRSVGDLSQNSFTLEAWINNPYKSDPTKKQILFGKATTQRYQTIVAGPPLLDYSLSLTSSSITATYYDLNNLQTVKADTGITPGKWHHLALVKDASAAKLFLNGKVIASTTSVAGSKISSATDSADRIERASFLYIAGHPEYNSFQGQIDEVRISSIARYTQDFSPSLSPFETEENALALYHFDGNTQDAINPSIKPSLIGQIDYTTSTIIPIPKPSPPVFNCFDSCKTDSNCSRRLKCIDVKGSRRCANPRCPTKANCACPEPPPPEPTPPPGSECSTGADCHLSLCDCKCHPSGQTPEEQTGKLCGINCLDEFKVSGCKCSKGTCSEIYLPPSPLPTPTTKPTPGPCEPNYLISFSVSQSCGKSNFRQVDFKCQHDVPLRPSADTCQSISQWLEYAQSMCRRLVSECPRPTPKPTPRPTPKPTPSPQYSQKDIESTCSLIDRYTNLETYTGTDKEKQKLQRLIDLASRIGLLNKVKITNVDQLLEFYYTYCKPTPKPTPRPSPYPPLFSPKPTPQPNQAPVIETTSLPSGQSIKITKPPFAAMTRIKTY